MHRLRHLWVREFRNYERLDLSFSPGVTALIGPNAGGKSNLLEAVYLVATGRSHRTIRESEAIRFDQEAARVRALIARPGREEELEATLLPATARAGVQLKVNGVPTPRGSVLGRLPVVMVAPWDIDVIRGAGAVRRRMIDAALAQLSPAYYFALHRYHRVLGQRNMALRQGHAVDTDPWDAQMITLGVRLTVHRRGYEARLASAATRWHEQLGGEGQLALTYQAAWAGGTEEEITAEARQQISRRRAEEQKRGVTLTGPHRDEVRLTLDDRVLRDVGSQGQWRTAMLAVRLAEREVMAAEAGGAPLLLLDDALAELDHRRQRRVLDLSGTGQVLLTATELPPEAPRTTVLVVKSGRVEGTAWSPQYERS
jgi:DNA replication and repair protein RecF